MGLFANWKALVSGFPSVPDWNRYTKAIALMRGQNGVRVFLQNGGAVIEGEGSESPWWKVIMKSGSTTVAQVSGGFVRVVDGYSTSAGMAWLSHGTTAGNPDMWTDVTLWLPTLGSPATGYIYMLAYACSPHNVVHIISDDLYGTTNTATYPPGEWEWTRVGAYDVDSLGAVSSLRRLFFSGDTIRVDVIPAGTVRMYGISAVPPGWQILDGTSGSVNAFGMSPRMDASALFGTLDGTLCGTLNPGDHYHDITVNAITGTSGSDNLGYGFATTPQQTGVAGTGSRSEKALAVVYAIKL